MSSKEFVSSWEQLSSIQRKAAEWDEGSILLLAGPGSGKTRVLTCRIANILDSTPEQKFRILGLTFTNKAADEIRTRVADFVPGQEGRLFLGTFHSFCADVLRQHGTHLGIKPNFNIYSQDIDLQAVLKEAVNEAKKNYTVSMDLDIKTLPVIQRLKTLLVLPEESKKLFKDEEFGERIAITYSFYDRELSKRNALDFNSLILKTYQLFKKYQSFAKRYRAVYRYICIDEFQDTNFAQYSLIKEICGDSYKNLFIVADDDQIIYQWNGASHKRIEEFTSDFSPHIIQLPMNFRCPSEIVDLANNLIQNNFLRTNNKEPLIAFRPKSNQDIVRLLPCFLDNEDEATGVAKDIKRIHSNNLGSVVILARTRRLLEVIDKAMKKEELPAIISQRKDEFQSTPFLWLHSILRLANNRQNKEYLEIVCGTFSQLTHIYIDPEDVITQAMTTNNDYLLHWIKEIRKKIVEPNLTLKSLIIKINKDLGEGRDFQAFSVSALNWFASLIKDDFQSDLSILAHYQEEHSVWEKLMRDIVMSLGSEVSLETFLQELQMRSKEPSTKPNTIRLMTIHGSKGKEFDHVYLIGLVDDELPSFQSKQKGSNSPEMEEERRNCFVAITRTVKTLTLCYAKKYNDWPKKPSRFLYEMGLLE